MRSRARFIDRMLRAALRAGPRSDAIRGDLAEEHARRRANGVISAAAWYLFQAASVASWATVDRLRGRPWTGEHPLERRRWGSSGLRRDLADGLRVLRRAPGYSLSIITTLGLALATTVTVFAVVRGVLLRDLPYPEPDRLVRIDRISDGEPTNGGVAYPDLIDWRAKVASLEAIAAHSGFEGTYRTEQVAELWRGRAVTENLLEVLRVTPVVGSGFAGGQGAPGLKNIIIAHHLWERHFGGDPGIIGRMIDVDDARWQVVGVLPRGFSFPEPGVDVLVPLEDNRFLENRGAGWLRTVARLAPASSLEAARTEVTTVVSAIDAETGDWDEGVVVRGYAEVEVAPVKRVLMIFMGAVLLVLLVACANVAGLAFARTESRRMELAVRASLGAGRGRLVRQLLAESVTVSVLGGVVGVVGAVVGVRALLATAPVDLPRRAAVQIDPTVLIFATVAAVAAGVLSGLLPALRGASGGTADGLRAGGTPTRPGRHTQELLAGAQIAVAVVLMFGAGLLLRSFSALTSVDPGFRADRAIVVELGLDSHRQAATPATIFAFHNALMARVAGLPGVSAVGLSSHLPFTGSNISVSMVREDEIFDDDAPTVGMEMYNGDYFGAMGLALIRGRAPALAGGVSQREVTVNEAAAQLLWPGQDPIGQRLSFDVDEGQASAESSFFTVVGVVPNVLKRTLEEEPFPLTYYHLPDFRQHYGFVSGRYFYLVVATEGDPYQLLTPVRAAIAELDGELPVRAANVLEDLVRSTTVSARFRTFALSAFAILAIAVAFSGVYAVMAYGVSKGVREIGIRMALGATPATVQQRVLRRAGLVIVVGGVFGVAGAVMVGPILASILYQVPSRDPGTLAAVLALAATGSLLAAFFPALRASRVDPMEVLREE